MNTAVTLIVNGEMQDFNAFMERAIANAMEKAFPQLQKTGAEPEFKIIPQMSYRISDERIIELFGCQHIEKNPAQAVINRLRSVGIEPQTRGRSGAVVFGHQILQYLDAVRLKTQPFLSK